MNNLYSLGLDTDKLISIGVKVGGDVPFFVKNYGTAEVGGIGERVRFIERDLSKFYVLIRPHKRISTKEMYEKHDREKKSFFEIAKEICPDIKKVYDYFSKGSEEYGMSGSGPTIFTGFDTYKRAIKSVEDFGIEKFNGDFFICRPVKETYQIINE